MWATAKRIGMVALFAAFALVGAALALIGGGEQRVGGIAIVLFFGGGGTAWYLTTRSRGRLPGFRVGLVGPPGRRRTAFIADYDRGHARIGGGGALAMAVACALFVFVPGVGGPDSGTERLVLMVGSAVLLGGVGLFALLRAGRGSQLALTPDGLHAMSPAGDIFVPWHAIAEIGEISVHDTPFLAVRVTSADEIRMSAIQWLAHRAQRSMFDVDLTFPLRALMVEPAVMAGALERYRTRPDARAAIGTAAELEALSVRPDVPAGASEVSHAGVTRDAGAGPSRTRVAAVSLLVVGVLLAVLTLLGALDEPDPGREAARARGLIAFGALALTQIAAGVLLWTRRAIGRWLGIGSALAMLALTLLATSQADGGSRAGGVVVSLVLVGQLALLLWATRRRPV